MSNTTRKSGFDRSSAMGGMRISGELHRMPRKRNMVESARESILSQLDEMSDLDDFIPFWDEKSGNDAFMAESPVRHMCPKCYTEYESDPSDPFDCYGTICPNCP